MMQVHAPIHHYHKWLKSIIVQYWHSLHIHYFHHSCPHPSLSKWLDSNICSFPINKIPLLFLSDPHLCEYIYDCKIPPSTSPIILRPHQYYTKPHLNNYRIYHLLCSIIPTECTIHITTIQHTHLPPCIHNKLFITMHTSPHYPIENHHNSQTSSDRHIFVAPWLSG